MKAFIISLLILGLAGVKARAQDPPRFQPPRPPPLDNDFDDPMDDDEPLDQPSHVMPGMQIPQVNQNSPSQPAPPTSEFRASSGNSKVQFHIVEGEFYEKGKPRGRAPIEKRSN